MSTFKSLKKNVRQYAKQLFYSLSDVRIKKRVEIRPNTLVIVRNDNIGDYILFRNFLPQLRNSEKYKHYKIVLIGNIVWKGIAQTMDGEFYDEMIWVNFKKLARDFGYRSKTMKLLTAVGYEELFYPVYSGDYFTENFLIAKLKARFKIKPASEYNNSTHVFNRLLPSAEGGMFELLRYREMVELLTSETIPEIKGLPIYEKNEHTPALLPAKKYVVLFPGASAYLKRWPTEYLAQVATYILKHSAYRIVIAGGAGDKKYAKAIKKALPKAYDFRFFDLTGRTSLQELAQLVNESDLLITNDSVPIHIAALYNKKAICVLMGENYGRFAPYPTSLYANGTFLFAPEVTKRINDTSEHFLNLSHNPDIKTILPDEVIALLDSMLNIAVALEVR